MTTRDSSTALRALPSVEALLQTEPLRTAAAHAPRALALAVARSEIERRRRAILEGDGGTPAAEALASSAVLELERLERPALRPVINATGVVIHTNLGRAPLPSAAIEAVGQVARGYSNLEYDLGEGGRGSRHVHVESLLCELTGAEAAIAVNNNAAAVLLALAALAYGREVVISRGQLVEIGGSFRIPEILAASGARLVEVGTTNRTRRADYERAISAESAALMRVHASNFRTLGFTEEVEIERLCELGAARGLAVIDDLGSGALAHGGTIASLLADEPSARRSVDAGADITCFSGDKLLGGPQAGILIGRREAVGRLRRHPLARAVRIDKLSLAALEATLRLHRDPDRAAHELPALAMLGASGDELHARAARLRDAISARAGDRVRVELVETTGRVGGGALPLLELRGPAVAVRDRGLGADELQARLRRGEPPVVVRVHEQAVLLDPRTIAEAEVEPAARAVLAALA